MEVKKIKREGGGSLHAGSFVVYNEAGESQGMVSFFRLSFKEGSGHKAEVSVITKAEDGFNIKCLEYVLEPCTQKPSLEYAAKIHKDFRDNPGDCMESV